MKENKVINVTIQSEQGGEVRLQNPFEGNGFKIKYIITSGKKRVEIINRLAKEEVIKINLTKGEEVVLSLISNK
jgi:hypothetical protein